VEHLLKAYMLDGEEIFMADAEGPHALKLLRDRRLVT